MTVSLNSKWSEMEEKFPLHFPFVFLFPNRLILAFLILWVPRHGRWSSIWGAAIQIGQHAISDGSGVGHAEGFLFMLRIIFRRINLTRLSRYRAIPSSYILSPRVVAFAAMGIIPIMGRDNIISLCLGRERGIWIRSWACQDSQTMEVGKRATEKSDWRLINSRIALMSP
jgi:hypothetical protein